MLKLDMAPPLNRSTMPKSRFSPKKSASAPWMPGRGKGTCARNRKIASMPRVKRILRLKSGNAHMSIIA